VVTQLADEADRADDRVAVSLPGHAGQLLGAVNRRGTCADRRKLAANPRRCVGLGIERVDVTHAPVQKHEDARLGARAARCRGGFPQPQKTRQRPEHRAVLKKPATGRSSIERSTGEA